MKHIFKNILILIFLIFFLILTIESSQAESSDNKIKLVEIKATSNKTVELKLDKDISNTKELKSDLEIYKSIENTPNVDSKDTKKVILTLKDKIESNSSYSLISISGVEGNILFKTGNDILGKEIQNPDLSDEEQGIKSIFIKDEKTLELNFLKEVDPNDLEFQLYKTVELDKMKRSDTAVIKVLLKKELQSNSEYLGTLTYIETEDLEKKDIEKGIYYFSTKELSIYNSSEDKTFSDSSSDTNDSKSLEETLMNALDNSKEIASSTGELLDGEEELKQELNSAKEEDKKEEKTQLEKLALSQKETPDSGAETWVLIFATLFLNTFYFLSRRKKK